MSRDVLFGLFAIALVALAFWNTPATAIDPNECTGASSPAQGSRP